MIDEKKLKKAAYDRARYIEKSEDIKARVRDYLKSHRKEATARARLWQAKNKVACAGYATKYASKNPKRKKAHVAVMIEVRAGRLKSLPCKICKNIKTQAHHLDYDNPLKIEWLCATHHKAWHRVFIPDGI